MTVPARTFSSPSPDLIVTPSASMSVTMWFVSDVTPSDSERLLGLGRQPLRERGQHPLTGLDEQHLRLPGVDHAELVARVAGDLGDLTGHLGTGRARTHDHERQQPFTLGRVGDHLRLLERLQDLRADVQRALERLELGGVLLPFRVAEVVVLGPAADDERVVVERLLARRGPQLDRLGVQVEALRLGEHDRDVLLPAEDACAADTRPRPWPERPWRPGRRAAGRGGSCGGRRSSRRRLRPSGSGRPAGLRSLRPR